MNKYSVLGKVGRPERFGGGALKNHFLSEFILHAVVQDEGV
jgi:hypothetical protein